MEGGLGSPFYFLGNDMKTILTKALRFSPNGVSVVTYEAGEHDDLPERAFNAAVANGIASGVADTGEVTTTDTNPVDPVDTVDTVDTDAADDEFDAMVGSTPPAPPQAPQARKPNGKKG